MRILLIVMLIFISSCKKSDEKTTIKHPDGTVEMDGDQVSMKTKDGSFTMNSSKIPDGFPIPVFKGAEIENSTHITDPNGLEIFQLSITTPQSVKEVTEFYEKIFKDKGVKFTRNEQTDGDSRMVMIFGNSDKLDVTAMISEELDDDQDERMTSATISWNPKP